MGGSERRRRAYSGPSWVRHCELPRTRRAEPTLGCESGSQWDALAVAQRSVPGSVFIADVHGRRVCLTHGDLAVGGDVEGVADRGDRGEQDTFVEVVTDGDASVGDVRVNGVDTGCCGDCFDDVIEAGRAVDVSGDVGEHESSSFNAMVWRGSVGSTVLVDWAAGE